mmetsp:Transcript_7831/g.17665  ORF Transcript_7831/g.17665 Transcript_7831/m.17665 type:complete len:113 (-) Transcript_7831:145-483(-)
MSNKPSDNLSFSFSLPSFIALVILFMANNLIKERYYILKTYCWQSNLGSKSSSRGSNSARNSSSSKHESFSNEIPALCTELGCHWRMNYHCQVISSFSIFHDGSRREMGIED